MEPAFVGDYRLIAALGRGGMAEVFLAVRSGMEGFHKLVVIKRLRGDLAALPHGAKYRELLLDEARLAARLGHPNIVQTFEVGEADGRPFLAMEYLDGQSLGRVLARVWRAERTLPVELALQIAIDALAGLSYAHDLADFDGRPLGLVHRDVSPHNVFWTYDGAIKLVDFGVAKVALNTHETEHGMVKGKLTYMAPEQARGQPVDRRADLFAVGIVLWEMIAGRRLLHAPTQAASLERLLFGELPPLTRVAPDVDPEIAQICSRALERDVVRRYTTAGEMRSDLERVLCDHSPRRPDLAGCIQALFRDERAAMADHIRAAVAGHGQPLTLPSSELPTRISALTHVPRRLRAASTPTAETAAVPAPSLAQAPVIESMIEPVIDPRIGPAIDHGRSRRWRMIGAFALPVVVAGITALTWRAIGRGPAVERAPSPARPAPAAAALAAAPASPVAPPPERPALQLCGSNTVGAELAPALVEAFLKRKGAEAIAREAGPEHARLSARLSGAALVIDIRAAGSATAFTGLASHGCDVGMASRAINDKERAALTAAGLGDMTSPATEHVIGLDGIAVVVHPNNPLSALDRGQLHDVFTGKLTDWSQLGGAAGAITVLSRDDNSGTFDTFKSLVLRGDPLRPGTSRLADSSALSDQVAGDPSAIGFIGLAYVRSAKALAVGDAGTAAKLPTSFTVTTEGYMLSRRLYMYTPPRPRTPLATELVSFVLSPQGQTVVRETGFIDLSVTLRDGERCDARCPASYAALTARAQRLSLDFRFRTGSDEIDSRASRDLDRVVQFLRSYPSAKLLLLGFSDAAGVPAANLKLSQHRAATIAHELALRGVHAASVEGMGAAMPVAPNTTEADRQRNRRVEVWIDAAR